MRPVRSLLIYLVVVFAGGALLAPGLYFLAQNAATHFPAFKDLADNPFHRFVNRSLLILAVAGLWPLVRSFQIQSWRDLGLGIPRDMARHLGLGFGIGFASLAIAAIITLLAGARNLNPNLTGSELWRHLINATSAALVVSLLEEIVFRGAVFGGLRRAISWKVALTISSFIYALVHFFSRPAPPSEIGWTTGFIILGQMLSGFTQLQSLFPALINLTLAGLILGLAFQTTGNLYLSIGLHAGWIFWLKSFGALTVTNQMKPFWGTSKLIDGWAASIILITLFIVFVRREKSKTTPHGN